MPPSNIGRGGMHYVSLRYPSGVYQYLAMARYSPPPNLEMEQAGNGLLRLSH